MRKIFCFLIVVFIISCGRQRADTGERIITVSIAPFKYFVEEIAGDDFKVNVMVPAGANPHIYEPFPEQINKLRRSVAYISNGYLGFEMTWLDRFYETNKTMKRLSLGDKIDPLVSGHHHEGDHVEGADPHYWVSPKCALIMATSVKEFLCELNPSQKQKYEVNYDSLISKIQGVDNKALELFSGMKNRSFMIFHPNLGYLARDYGLEEIPVEYEGKEPPPSRLKELIDRAREDGLKIIFVQREYDTKNAKAIADEIGAEVKIIDPLSEEWQKATMDIINALHNSLTESSK
ncbi:MAG: zinc ABC transporter substrate-binding protein [Bacteroidales bacterium]|nr:zinc ABC transporter substrate-binding protein [Bacteroidales bacterium]MDP3003727.1 zinc ABC transporter substrate-binding protein [Bacteroidales bacterium]